MPTEADLYKNPEKGNINAKGWAWRPPSLMKMNLNEVFLKMGGNFANIFGEQLNDIKITKIFKWGGNITGNALWRQLWQKHEEMPGEYKPLLSRGKKKQTRFCMTIDTLIETYIFYNSLDSCNLS